VHFKTSLEAAPQVVAGVAYLDVSRLTLAAGYKHVDTMFYITVATALVVAGLIFVMGRIITRPILKLAEAVTELPHHPELTPIELPYYGREITVLQKSINTLIATLKRQMEEIRQKDKTIRSASLKEQAFLDQVISEPGPEGALKSEILKAAQVGVDVLIIGETGTGKQLAAEAIHRLSGRAAKPFISINCGALDENLLLDTLFGHVRGAFTEAKTDRKGAFLEADQGTLFLDEIQVASPRVQQAMLRAIAVRKIKPLGSDREIDVDVRLIVASNVDLRDLIQRGEFREDLYFRLKVITIHTLPLREQKENIPLLARHFLNLQQRIAGRTGMGLSKGALSKLLRYDWPGNVRELQNCITRAVVMSERPIIQADDIPLDVETLESDHDAGLPSSAGTNGPEGPALTLNHRQRKAWTAIMAKGRISRSQYQEIIGGNLPPRTAIYDLQDLVSKGVLKKTGSGPATHYILSKKSDSGRQ
jgi:DNA-binding NtrC family response regulator